MAKQLLDYFQEQSSKYTKNLKLLVKQPKEDPVHDFRVAVKRLRTVLLLLHEIYPVEENLHIFTNVTREIYKLTGKLRDLQLQVNMLETLSLKTGIYYTHYLADLRKKETLASVNLSNYLKDHPLIGKTELVVLSEMSLWNETNATSVMILVDNMIDELIQQSIRLNYMNRDPEDLHDIRRNLKQCQYLLSMSKTFDHVEHDIHSKKLTIVSHAGELLGKWHDLEVSTRSLAKFYPQIKDIEYFNKKYKNLKSSMKSDMKKTLDSTCLYLNFVFQVFT